MTTGNEVAPDQNVEDLRELLKRRAEIGLAKYGVTTMREDLDLRAWLQHALEETLDKAVYLRAAIRKLDGGECMSTGKELGLEAIKNAADHLVALAKSRGVVLTIEQKPLMPPAMGNYETVVSVREARK